MSKKYALWVIRTEKCVVVGNVVRTSNTRRKIYDSYTSLVADNLVCIAGGFLRLSDRGVSVTPTELSYNARRRAIDVLSQHARFVLMPNGLRSSDGVTMTKPISRYVAELCIAAGILRYDDGGYLVLDVPKKTVTLTFAVFSGDIEAVRNAVHGVTGNDQHRHHK